MWLYDDLYIVVDIQEKLDEVMVHVIGLTDVF
jgi:hypothetical protein